MPTVSWLLKCHLVLLRVAADDVVNSVQLGETEDEMGLVQRVSSANAELAELNIDRVLDIDETMSEASGQLALEGSMACTVVDSLVQMKEECLAKVERVQNSVANMRLPEGVQTLLDKHDIGVSCHHFDEEIAKIEEDCVGQAGSGLLQVRSGCSANDYSACSNCAAKQEVYNAAIQNNARVCESIFNFCIAVGVSVFTCATDMLTCTINLVVNFPKPLCLMGKWERIRDFPGSANNTPAGNQAVTYGREHSTSETSTDTFYESVTTEVNAGFSYGAFSAGASVSGTSGSETSQSITSAMRETSSETTAFHIIVPGGTADQSVSWWKWTIHARYGNLGEEKTNTHSRQFTWSGYPPACIPGGCKHSLCNYVSDCWPGRELPDARTGPR